MSLSVETAVSALLRGDTREAYYQTIVEHLRQSNLRALSVLYSDVYAREREHAEWIDHGGEA